MKSTILSFVCIVFWHVSAAQILGTSSSQENQNYDNCPLMEVSISSNNYSGILEVSYCNHGNTIAIGASVEIEVTNGLPITQTTLPVSSVVGQTYTFYLGDVNSSDCGAFYIEIPNVEDKIHCTNVQIFPNDPCQGMIDRYALHITGDTDDANVDDTHTISVTFTEQMQRSAVGPPLLGQGGTNAVFEDHVFLNHIPTWDSLLSVLTHSGVLPSTTIVPTAVTMNTLNDISALASAELCSSRAGSTVVLGNTLSQVTNLAVGDRRASGTTVDNNQTASTALTIKTHIDTYKNKKVAVRLSPNPFSESATITIDGPKYQQTTVEIIDLSGKSIQSLQVNEEQGITIHRKDMSPGVYFYRLIGDNIAVHTGKFVVR